MVIDILTMRFHRPGAETAYSSSLLAMARNVMLIYPFSNDHYPNSSLDYDLTQIAKICLKGEEGKDTATTICRHLAEAMADGRVSTFVYPSLLNSFACIQPLVFLDMFFRNNMLDDYQRERNFSDDFLEINPINQIADTDLLSWCNYEPENRYPLIAAAIQPFSISTETGDLEWKPIVHSIFEKAPDLAIILERFAAAIKWVSSGRDSRAEFLRKRSVLFQNLYQHDNVEVGTWAMQQYQALQEIIKEEQESERYRNRQRNESFE